MTTNRLVYDLSRHSDQNLLVIYDNEKLQVEFLEQKYEAGEKTLHNMQQITYHRDQMNEAASQLTSRAYQQGDDGQWYLACSECEDYIGRCPMCGRSTKASAK